MQNKKINPRNIISYFHIMQGYKKLFLAVIFSICLFSVQGQNTYSPYSRYGYGVLSDKAIGASKSMGGISYGVRGLNANPSNPASYTGVDSLTFIFDIGISYSKSRLSEGKNSQKDDNGGLDYIAMQFPISRKLGMSLGLLPFSSVGYSFGTNDITPDKTSTRQFEGSGGISKVYAGAAYEIFRNLSIGANVAYIFGNTTNERSLNITSEPSAPTVIDNRYLRINTVQFDLGAQYTLQLNKDNNLTIGGVLSPQHRSSGRIKRISGEENETEKTEVFVGQNAPTDLPNTLGLGFTWNKKQNLTVGADVTFQDWSRMRFSKYMNDDMTFANRFNDVWKFNAGFEYCIDPLDRSFLKKMKFRGGLNYNNSYINVISNDGTTSGYKEYGATLGIGFPIKDVGYSGRTSYINLGFEYKNVSPNKSNLIKEEYFGISVGITLNELWFMKRKFR